MSNPSSGKTKIVELEVVKGFPENILEVRTMTEDKFIENHGSGSLRKAKKLGTAYKSLYKELGKQIGMLEIISENSISVIKNLTETNSINSEKERLKDLFEKRKNFIKKLYSSKIGATTNISQYILDVALEDISFLEKKYKIWLE